jgi:hypothetical protein
MLKTKITAIMLATVALTGAAHADIAPLTKPSAEVGENDGRGDRVRRGPDRDPAEFFAMLDADSSGGVTLEEYISAREAMERPEGARRPAPDAEKLERRFLKIDADENGEVTFEELTNAIAEFKDKYGERGPKPDKKPADDL